MKSEDRVFHVISNTHWDREWRYPFQKNRQMLVEMIDEVLAILTDNEDYRAFHLDSQSIVLTDYLEIRPDKKDIIKKLVKQGRLLIGPWFVLPDEFLVSGENLIRNLLLGHRICSEFGKVMKVGYSPFSWGQISQLPQLYKGFGVNIIMFYRGINSIDSPKAEFLWEGADGTQTLSSRFSTMPRYNFYFYIYRPAVHNEFFSDVEYKWTSGGMPFHFADSSLAEEDYSILSPNERYYKENLKQQVEKIIADQVNDFTTPHVIWMEGHDSSGPNEKTVRIIKDINELFPELNVKHSTLEEYAKGLLESANKNSLTVVKGERRSAQFDLRSGNLYGYTTSARMYLKQKNFMVESWLQFYAEPFNSYASLNGMNDRDNYLKIAWNLLLQNSGHDSIGGCSMDQIHTDMMNRYDQSETISKGVFERAAKYLTKQINFNLFPKNKTATDNQRIFITVFNPTQFDRTEISETHIDLPTDLNPGGFMLKDENGKMYKPQIMKVSKKEPILEQMIDRPMFYKMTRYRCFLELDKIPANGYKVFEIIPTRLVLKQEESIAKLFYGRPALENKFLTVSVNTNGTLYIEDKINKKNYDNIGYFYDEGEAGHAWVNRKAGPVFTTLSSKPVIKITENGKLAATVSIKHDFKIPFDRANEQNKNSATKNKRTDLPIELIVTLKKDSPCINLEVNLTNNAENHRLRMNFPTELDAKFTHAEGGFDVVARSTARPDTSGWIEQPMYDYPMNHFVDVSDEKNGMAFITQGLKEYEFLNDKKKTLSLTLFRAFTYVIQPSSVQVLTDQKGSQCPGNHNYKISLFPHKGSWAEGKVYENALKTNLDLRIAQTGFHKGSMPVKHSFIQTTSYDIIISCFKQAEHKKSEYILRAYNPYTTKKKVTFEFSDKLINAEFVTLEEKVIKKIEIKDENKIELNFDPKKILTLRLKF